MAFLISTFTFILLLAPNVFAQEVQNISLTSYPEPNGSFIVEVTWDAPHNIDDIAHYQIYQIQGVGEGISPPQTVPSSAHTLRITDVPSAGSFGVSVQVVWKDGHSSHGAFASLGDPTPLLHTPPPLVASVIPPPPPVGLSREDLGMVLFVVTTGAIVGTMSVKLFHRA